MSSNARQDEDHSPLSSSDNSLSLHRYDYPLPHTLHDLSQQGHLHPPLNPTPPLIHLCSMSGDHFEENPQWSDSNESGWTSGEETVLGEYMDKEYDESPSAKAHAYHYPSRRTRRPLIDFVRNEWRTNPKPGQAHSSSPDRHLFHTPRWRQVVSARKVRRYALFYLLLLCMSWVSWNCWLEPMYAEHLLLRGSLDERMNTGKGWFGANMRPKFKDIIQLEELDSSLIPRGGKESRRLIVIGDVHGCKEEREFSSQLFT